MDSLFAAGAAAALTSKAASAYDESGTDSSFDDTKPTGMVAPGKTKKAGDDGRGEESAGAVAPAESAAKDSVAKDPAAKAVDSDK